MGVASGVVKKCSPGMELGLAGFCNTSKMSMKGIAILNAINERTDPEGYSLIKHIAGPALANLIVRLEPIVQKADFLIVEHLVTEYALRDPDKSSARSLQVIAVFGYVAGKPVR
jgi:hypothetical protein